MKQKQRFHKRKSEEQPPFAAEKHTKNVKQFSLEKIKKKRVLEVVKNEAEGINRKRGKQMMLDNKSEQN